MYHYQDAYIATCDLIFVDNSLADVNIPAYSELYMTAINLKVNYYIFTQANYLFLSLEDSLVSYWRVIAHII